MELQLSFLSRPRFFDPTFSSPSPNTQRLYWPTANCCITFVEEPWKCLPAHPANFHLAESAVWSLRETRVEHCGRSQGQRSAFLRDGDSLRQHQQFASNGPSLVLFAFGSSFLYISGFLLTEQPLPFWRAASFSLKASAHRGHWLRLCFTIQKHPFRNVCFRKYSPKPVTYAYQPVNGTTWLEISFMWLQFGKIKPSF